MITQPLREEHKALFPEVEKLRIAADSAGQVSAKALRLLVDEAYGFLTHHLIPHARAEDEALYPVVGRVMGAPEATATMSRDHIEVGKLTSDLSRLRLELATAAPSEVQVRELRLVLYGLYALVKHHFAKEEEIYLPLLDERLTPEEAHEMFEALERAAEHAKQAPSAEREAH
jgi:iron-sulfur cluster repair protein YtfE (RIC family)